MTRLTDGIVLYHGSYCAVERPDLEKCSVFKDFGQGFYLTTSKEQAKSFARLTTYKAKRNGIIPAEQQSGYISVFRFSSADGLTIKYFESADSDWLHCIVAHRKRDVFPDVKRLLKDYEIVAGKIANDNTNTTIMAYMGNVFGEPGSQQADNMCISLLLPEKIKDQFCFRSEKAISRLDFLNTEKVSVE